MIIMDSSADYFLMNRLIVGKIVRNAVTIYQQSKVTPSKSFVLSKLQNYQNKSIKTIKLKIKSLKKLEGKIENIHI